MQRSKILMGQMELEDDHFTMLFQAAEKTTSS